MVSILFSPAAGLRTVSFVPSAETTAFVEADCHLNTIPLGAVGKLNVVSSFSGIVIVAFAIAASTSFKYVSPKFIGSQLSVNAASQLCAK